MREVYLRAAFAVFCMLCAISPAACGPSSFTEEQKRSIEDIVTEYLLNHPEVLQKVQEALEKKTEYERLQAIKNKMPIFHGAMENLKKELSGFAVGEGDVTVYEFFDYNCKYCRATLPELTKLVASDRNIKIQFLEYPILSQESKEVAKVSIAASKQGKFFEFHKAMFATNSGTMETALSVAKQIGLDMAQVKVDMQSPETEAVISKIAYVGKLMSVDGVPTFIIGEKMQAGWTLHDQFKGLVEEARKLECGTSCTATSNQKSRISK